MATWKIAAFIFVVLMPFANARECALSASAKKRILEQAEKLPDVNYQNFPVPKSGKRTVDGLDEPDSWFPRETKISQLADASKNLFLFRTIQSKYDKNYRPKADTYIKSEGNAYSYSLSPAMAAGWEYGNTFLISLQNITGDALLYPKMDMSAKAYRVWIPILDDTKTGDIAHYDEIKVPVEKENVVIVFQKNDLKGILKDFGKKPYSLKDLVRKIVSSPSAMAPSCEENNPGLEGDETIQSENSAQ